MESWTFHDFDEYAAAVRDVNLEMLLQTLVHRRWTIRHLDVAGVHIQHGSQGSGDITRGQSRADGYVLYLPLKHEQGQRANGRTLDANAVVIFEPGSEFCLSSNVDHEWCTVFIPTDQLFTSPELTDLSAGRSRLTQLTPRVAQQYRNLLLRILVAVENCEALSDSPALEAPMLDLRQLSARIVELPSTSRASADGRPRLPREEILGQAMRLLDARGQTSQSIGDLAAACDVSERTLRSVFREYFGAAPLRYLQLRRLHEIRRALHAADPHATTVSELLTSYGEWEFGRFAQRYRKTFGELPSATLLARIR